MSCKKKGEGGEKIPQIPPSFFHIYILYFNVRITGASISKPCPSMDFILPASLAVGTSQNFWGVTSMTYLTTGWNPLSAQYIPFLFLSHAKCKSPKECGWVEFSHCRKYFLELPEWREFFWSKRTRDEQTIFCYFSVGWILYPSTLALYYT